MFNTIIFCEFKECVNIITNKILLIKYPKVLFNLRVHFINLQK